MWESILHHLQSGRGGAPGLHQAILARCMRASAPSATPPPSRKLREQESATPSLYVGETSRSSQERAEEHWGAAKRKNIRSHIHKHQSVEHEGEESAFIFKVISHHRTALSRQVKEAVRIRRRGGSGNILNSKGEFNRCYIPRMTVEQEDEEVKKKRREMEETEKKELRKIMEEDEQEWERKKN